MSEMAYIGVEPCGCVTAALVDRPAYAAENAKEIARIIRSGQTVERVTVEEARQRFCPEWPCEHERTRRAEARAAKHGQESLL